MITAKNLSKSFGPTLALDNVSFKISTGEIVGLLGSNGAGKSTLIKILAGVLVADQGEAILNGFSILENRTRAQSVTGYLPESVAGFESSTVLEFIQFSARSHGFFGKELNKLVFETINYFDLKSVYNKKMSDLSKGWRQRTWLAQCFVNNPTILFLDEPTDGLDPLQKITMRKKIKELGKVKTIMMSTHILEEAELICDRLLVLHRGRVVTDGSIDELVDEKGRLETQLINVTR